MVGWHHRLNGHEYEQTRGDSEGQRSLATVHGVAESDTTWQLNNNAPPATAKTQHSQVRDTHVD